MDKDFIEHTNNLIETYPEYPESIGYLPDIAFRKTREAIVGRSRIKQCHREVEGIRRDLMEIEENFYKALFNEGNDMSYQEIYTICLEEFQKRMIQAQIQFKFKILVPNMKYFEYLFKPYNV